MARTLEEQITQIIRDGDLVRLSQVDMFKRMLQIDPQERVRQIKISRCAHMIDPYNLEIAKLRLRDGERLVHPIHLAAKFNHSHLIDFVLDEFGTRIYEKDEANRSVIHIAAEYGHDSLLRHAYNRGCEVHGVSSFGLIPLHHAIINGHLEIVKTIFELNALSRNDEIIVPRKVIFDRYSPTILQSGLDDVSLATVSRNNVENRYRINFSSLCPFLYSGNHPEILEWFLTKDIPIDFVSEHGYNVICGMVDKYSHFSIQSLIRVISMANRKKPGLGLEMLNHLLPSGETFLNLATKYKDIDIQGIVRLGATSSVKSWDCYRDYGPILLAAGIDVIHMNDSDRNEANEMLTNEYILSVRHQCYFAESLTARLLLELGA